MLALCFLATFVLASQGFCSTRQNKVQSVSALSRQVDAPAADGYAYLQQEFGEAGGDVGLKSALSQLWRRDGDPYVDARIRLPMILGLTYFAGELRISGDTELRQGQGDVMKLHRYAVHVPLGRKFEGLFKRFFAYREHDVCQDQADAAKMCIMHGADAVKLWKATTKPDAVVAPPDARGNWTELVTEGDRLRTPFRATKHLSILAAKLSQRSQGLCHRGV